MSQLVPKIRRLRRDAIYTLEEMAVIGKHKVEYKLQTTKEARKQVMQKILLDIFTYWDQRGNIAADEEENVDRAKVSQLNLMSFL